MTKGREWLDGVQISGRTRAGLAFTSSVTQLLFFNDEVRDRDKKLRRRVEGVSGTAETAEQDALLVWLAETLDFEHLRLTLSVVHLVTVFEAYLLDTIREILFSCPQALKTNRQLTYREVFSFHDMESLRAYAIDCEAEKLGYKSYQSLAKHFAERFGIDFSQLSFTGETNLDEDDVLALVRNSLLIGDKENGVAKGMRIDQRAVAEVFATRNILYTIRAL